MDTATPVISTYLPTRSLPDAIPISAGGALHGRGLPRVFRAGARPRRAQDAGGAPDAGAGPRAGHRAGAHRGRRRGDRGAARQRDRPAVSAGRSEEHTSELQSLMRISYAGFCLKKKKIYTI